MQPLFSYPQIHYFPIRFFKGLLYKKEPVIIIDAPRYLTTYEIPVYIFVKNANCFNITLKEIEIFDENISKKFKLNEEVNQYFFYKKIVLETSKIGKHTLKVNLTYLIQNKVKKINFSNLPFVKKNYLDVFILPTDYYKGFVSADMHVHSLFTDDHVEFGLPVEVYNDVSTYINLDFFAITDHSYDLDDEEGYYYKPDKALRKVEQLKVLEKAYPKMILGHEVSCGNLKNKNVHLLVFSDKIYFGAGDSGERLFRNKPNISCNDIIEKEKYVIAAHPFDKPNIFEGFLLNRGYYSYKDLKKIDVLQIINKEFTIESIKKFLNYLTKIQEKKYIIAGNDSHGYLGWSPHIVVPLFYIGYSENYLFGQNRTIIESARFHGSIDKYTFLEKVFEGQNFVTNGPLMEVEKNDKNINILVKSNEVFGKIETIIFFWISKNFCKQEEIKINKFENEISKNIISKKFGILVKTEKNFLAFKIEYYE